MPVDSSTPNTPPPSDAGAKRSRPSKIWVLAKREYATRIKSKGFWIATLVLPLFMAAMFIVPGLVISKTRSQQTAVIVDETGQVAEGVISRLQDQQDDDQNATLSLAEEAPAADRQAQVAALDQRVLDGDLDAWIWVSEAGLEEDTFEYHAESVSNLFTQSVIERAVSAEVRSLRLTEAGLDAERIRELSRGVDIQTVRVSAEGSREETGFAGFILAYGMFFLLYLILLIWGQQVLTGVLEEKSSRIVEVIVSSATPRELMMGKLTGIGLAGLTQLGTWLVTMTVLTAPGIATALATLPEGFNLPTLSPVVAVFFALFFLLGFFVYSSIYAAVGSAFNNLQEAQQLAAVPMAFIIAPVMVVMPVINDPDGALATISSLIPIFTPMLMPVRIAVKMPPAWEIALSLLLTTAFVFFMVWLCGRIYRVGILMHGKKPTLREIWRWVRYA
ncbi:MAG: ABC transporter permease [Acidobacteriota bacterium]